MEQEGSSLQPVVPPSLMSTPREISSLTRSSWPWLDASRSFQLELSFRGSVADGAARLRRDMPRSALSVEAPGCRNLTC